MNVLEQVLTWKDTWAVVPVSVADALTKLSHVKRHTLLEPPQPRFIYALIPSGPVPEPVMVFLDLLEAEIAKTTGIEVFSQKQKRTPGKARDPKGSDLGTHAADDEG